MIRLLTALALATLAAAQSAPPAGPLAMRDFRLQFDPAGTFSLSGAGWPAMSGTWKMSGAEMTLLNQSGPKDCLGEARYTLSVDGARVGLDVIADECQSRRMILDRSRWTPPGTAAALPSRSIVRTAGTTRTPLTRVAPGAGAWPSFRGPEASGVSDSPSPAGSGA